VKKTPTVWNILDTFPAKNLTLYENCKDSKILTEQQRKTLYQTLTKNKNICYSTAKISAADIDKH
jgi:ribonuclease HII